jgi:hypothetical protein
VLVDEDAHEWRREEARRGRCRRGGDGVGDERSRRRGRGRSDGCWGEQGTGGARRQGASEAGASRRRRRWRWW